MKTFVNLSFTQYFMSDKAELYVRKLNVKNTQ